MSQVNVNNNTTRYTIQLENVENMKFYEIDIHINYYKIKHIFKNYNKIIHTKYRKKYLFVTLCLKVHKNILKQVTIN